MDHINEVKSTSEDLLNLITKDYSLDVTYDKENDCYEVYARLRIPNTSYK